jgi:hypothetical protein
VFKLRKQFDWVIDFGIECSLKDAAVYQEPFEHLRNSIAEERIKDPKAVSRSKWWIHKCPRSELRQAIEHLPRYLVTPRVGRRRIFVWLPTIVLPDSRLFAFASDDDYFFGVLQSRVHELWALRKGARHGAGDDPTYNNRECFETFPFPEPSNAQRQAIIVAAREIDTLRNNWLNPPEWTHIEILEFPGSTNGLWRRYIDPATADSRGIGIVRYSRTIAKDEECAMHLRTRTLTNLYNERPTWLDLAHKKLDEAVFAAYSWQSGMSDEHLLGALLALNLDRATV